MPRALTINYPIGGDSPLTGQTRQSLSSELFKLLGNETLSAVQQDFNGTKGPNNEVSFVHGTYILRLTPNVGVEIDDVRARVIKLLTLHPGASLRN